MIGGYPQEPTVTVGGELELRVSTDARAFRIEVYRVGASMDLVHATGWLPGCWAPPHLPWQDWSEDGTGLRGEHLEAWPAFRVPVGAGWRPGVHVAVLVEAGRQADRAAALPTADARSGTALFVVRPPAPASTVLYKVPLFTYHAYNRVSADGFDRSTLEGGWSLYTVPAPGDLPLDVPPAVSLHRPGGGTGGTPSDIDNFDPFDPTPRQTFVHWDARFVAWLEREGHAVDYCTDLDVHRDADGSLLGGYALLASAGHDEYWTDEMRAHVGRFARRGGNVAFFGGNTCWYRIAFDDPVSFRRAGEWSDPAAADDPENALTGVSYRNGGERDRDDFPVPVGYEVQHADHWVFDGTGLGDGDRFGHRAGEYLVGYECDGAHFDRSRLGRGRPVVPTGDDGTPASFTILGIGDAGASGWGLGNRAATMGLHRPGGTVFTAATTDWPRLLGDDPHPVVARITANVIERLAATTPPGPPARRAW